MKKNTVIRISGQWVMNSNKRDIKRFASAENAKAWVKKHFPKAYNNGLYSIHSLGY